MMTESGNILTPAGFVWGSLACDSAGGISNREGIHGTSAMLFATMITLSPETPSNMELIDRLRSDLVIGGGDAVVVNAELQLKSILVEERSIERV